MSSSCAHWRIGYNCFAYCCGVVFSFDSCLMKFGSSTDCNRWSSWPSVAGERDLINYRLAPAPSYSSPPFSLLQRLWGSQAVHRTRYCSNLLYLHGLSDLVLLPSLLAIAEWGMIPTLLFSLRLYPLLAPAQGPLLRQPLERSGGLGIGWEDHEARVWCHHHQAPVKR